MGQPAVRDQHEPPDRDVAKVAPSAGRTTSVCQASTHVLLGARACSSAGEPGSLPEVSVATLGSSRPTSGQDGDPD
jgi:hypothetical protein